MPELAESIVSINRQLKDAFGSDTVSGRAMWRVVFSDDEIEKRKGTFNDFDENGTRIRTVTEIREVPKYRQYIHQKYVLEQLVARPDEYVAELGCERVGYECKYVFMGKQQQYLPPRFDVAKFVIELIYAAMGKSLIPRYKDPDSNPEEARANYAKKLQEYEEYLGQDSTPVSDAFAEKRAVSLYVPERVQ